LAVAVDQADERNRRVADPRSQKREILEALFGRRVENVVLVESGQPRIGF
jgi:hypothetical protein